MPFLLKTHSEPWLTRPGEPVHKAGISGKETGDLKTLFRQLAKAFDFPAWFGENLDALYDGLTDLDWLSANTIILDIDRAETICSTNPEDQLKFTSVLKKVLTYYDHDLKNFIVIAEPSFLEKIKP